MGNSSSTSTPNIQDPPPSVKTQENERESASFFDDTPVKGKGTQASPSRKTTLLSSWFFGSDHSGGYLKILFCGLDTFPAAYIYTALGETFIVHCIHEHLTINTPITCFLDGLFCSYIRIPPCVCKYLPISLSMYLFRSFFHLDDTPLFKQNRIEI